MGRNLQKDQNIVVGLVGQFVQNYPLVVLDGLVVVINQVFQREQDMGPTVGALNRFMQILGNLLHNLQNLRLFVKQHLVVPTRTLR